MSESKTLRALDMFRPLFQSLRIDYPVMRQIVEVKLLMDSRRTPTVFAGSKKKENANQFIKSLGIYMLYSLIVLPFIWGDAYMMQMSIVFGIAMFLLMTTMVADFSSVLLDVRDTAILHTKPVDSRTINAAKIVHVFIYITMLTLAFTIIPIIVMLLKQGLLFTLIFIIEMVLLVLFIIACTSLVYIFVLRFFSGDKLKDMINYIQIILSLGIIIGYQIVIHAFDITKLELVYEYMWWHIFIPPLWFGAPYEWLLLGNTSLPILVLTALVIIVPFASIYLYYYFMPTFEQNLEKLLATSGERKQRFPLMKFWEKIVCHDQEERLYFWFANKVTGEEREFKLQAYPYLGIGIVLPFMLLFSELRYETLDVVSEGKTYLNMYFINMVIGSLVYLIQFSGSYQGAWIFGAAGVRDRRKIFRATFKVLIIKYYLPLFMFVSIPFIYIFSSKILFDLAIVFNASLLVILFAFKVIVKADVPFSQPFESMRQGGSSTANVFLILFIAFAFWIVHIFISLIPYGLIIYFGLLFTTNAVLWTVTFKKESGPV